MAIFLAFVVVTMTIVIRVARHNTSAADFYAAMLAESKKRKYIADDADWSDASEANNNYIQKTAENSNSVTYFVPAGTHTFTPPPQPRSGPPPRSAGW